MFPCGLLFACLFEQNYNNERKYRQQWPFIYRYAIARFNALQGFTNRSKAQQEYKPVLKTPLHKSNNPPPADIHDRECGTAR